MSRKRGNGEGSIYRRKDGRWVGQYLVYLPSGPKYRYIYARTRKEAADKLTKAMADCNGGIVFDDENLTVSGFLKVWLSDCAKGSVRTSTFERYESIAELQLAPALGRSRLKALMPAHVQGFYRGKLDGGLSPATVQKIHVVLHKAIKQAVMWNMVPRNVTEAVTPPRPAEDEIRPLDAEQAEAMLRAADETGDRLEALYVLAITSGMRQGELLALKWEDVDLERKTLRVRRTLTRSKGTMTLGQPKTAKSRRTIPLTSRAVAALRRHRAQQAKEKLKAGGLYEDRGLVFASEAGGITNPSNLQQRSFARLIKSAGLPETTRFHDLRHTCATLLLSRGQHPKLVQELLGHANISITLDTYSHVLPGMGDGLADAMDDAIGGG